jgi:regulator of protease activity HflC (stomatin/prohibitin superfamily)
MADDIHEENNNIEVEVKEPRQELDAGSKSLSEALRLSFIILKVIMIVLVLIFVFSGFRNVASDEQAIVLFFGKIQGVGEDRILGQGLHWAPPYPIAEVVKINVGKKVNLAVNSFWYAGIERVPPNLDPRFEGYCIVRGQQETQGVTGARGDDYSIVHSKWNLTYKIDDPERFFRNIYVKTVKPGESEAEIIAESIKPLLKNLVEDSVVTAMVNYSIGEIISSQDRIPSHVERLVQGKLDEIESGIRVVSMQMERAWPRQVDLSFQSSIMASQAKQKAKTEAQSFARDTLIETAGVVAYDLLEVLEGKEITKEQEQQLWANLAGQAKAKITEAQAYKINVVENAQANAKYLQQILPEYRKRKTLVLQDIYRNALEEVLNNVDEKIIVQPTSGQGRKEFRIVINPDPALKQGK